MASLLRPLSRPVLGLGLGLSITTLHLSHQPPLRLDSGSVSSAGSSAAPATDFHRRNARTPLLRNGNLNPGAVRQVSSGSIIGMYTVHPFKHQEPSVSYLYHLGLCAGLVVSTFSKSLALLIGLLVVGVQVGHPLMSLPQS